MECCKRKEQHTEIKVAMYMQWRRAKEKQKERQKGKHPIQLWGCRRTKGNYSPLLAGDGEQQLPSPSLAIILKN